MSPDGLSAFERDTVSRLSQIETEIRQLRESMTGTQRLYESVVAHEQRIGVLESSARTVSTRLWALVGAVAVGMLSAMARGLWIILKGGTL